MGLSLCELDLLEYGLVMDMMTESLNDEVEYPLKAEQKQFNEFLGG
ncbi:MAG: hypothetical protein IJV14_06535 [Lachnospiraceae bacterium]|nr:hypothetical protein [Lachnospiraceae bacterium]